MTGYDVRTISLAGIPGAAAITALALGADGNVYAGLTGDGHVLARISAADDRVEDLGRIFPERRGMAPVLDKIHNSLVPGPDGALYLGQGLNIDWNAAPRGCDLAAYGGGHLFRFDPGTGRLDDLGVPVPLNAIHGMAMDPARRILYGYTIPDNHFFVHRLDDRVSTDLGKIGSYASHNLVVGKNGTVYGGFFGDVGFTGGASEPERKIRHSGTYLFRCRPDDGRLQRTTEMVVYGDEHDIFSNKGIDAWTVASDGTIYGGTAVGGFVFTVDEDTGRVAAIGKPVVGPRVSGIREGPGGIVYLTAGFPNMHLVRYHPGEMRFTDHGPVVDDRELCYFHGLVVRPDGTVYVGETDSALALVYKLEPRGSR